MLNESSSIYDLNMFYLGHVRESVRLVVFRYPMDELFLLAVRENEAHSYAYVAPPRQSEFSYRT
jgi:hypothetical protein